MPARLKKIFNEKLVPELKQKLELKNTMEVPRILKITVNMGVGEAVADKKVMDAATADMAKITGQKPAVTKAKKSVATFKVRDGQAIGCKVTLRGDRMYEFLDRRAKSLWASKSRLFFPRFSTTKSIKFAAWTSLSPRRQETISVVAHCSKLSTFRSASR